MNKLPTLVVIKTTICEACLNGEGEECHTPGCALYLHAIDIPWIPELYEVIERIDLGAENKKIDTNR